MAMLHVQETKTQHDVHSVFAVDVVIVRWPEESDRLEELRMAGSARLLLVAPSVPLPGSTDCLEDWVRLPADDSDVRARAAALAARAEVHGTRPEIDGDGLIRHRGQWAPLSPVERVLSQLLVERFGTVVGRDSLTRRAWPTGAPTRNALDVHMLRLRRRIEPLGLEIKTVRARGYLLQETSQVTDSATP